MDSLKALLENLKEKLKAAWAEQQESELFISTKEKYEALSPLAQKGIIFGVVSFVVILFLWLPFSWFLDSADSNSKFNERKLALRELIKIDREMASTPNLPPAPPIGVIKAQFDSKISAAGIKPDQVRNQVEMPPQKVFGTDQKGILYTIGHLTIRQALDLSYELEHTNPTFKLAGVELIAEAGDPHYYQLGMKLVTFIPKVVENTAGKDIVDAIKKKRSTEDKSAE